jgi:hypothetical protein
MVSNARETELVVCLWAVLAAGEEVVIHFDVEHGLCGDRGYGVVVGGVGEVYMHGWLSVGGAEDRLLWKAP